MFQHSVLSVYLVQYSTLEAPCPSPLLVHWYIELLETFSSNLLLDAMMRQVTQTVLSFPRRLHLTQDGIFFLQFDIIVDKYRV